MKSQQVSLIAFVIIACLLMLSSPGIEVALAQTQKEISNSLNSLVQESTLLYNALSEMVSSAQADASLNHKVKDAFAAQQGMAKDAETQAKKDKQARNTVDSIAQSMLVRVNVLAPASANLAQAVGRAVASHDIKTYGPIATNSQVILAQMKDLHAGLDRMKNAAKGASLTGVSVKQLIAMQDSLHRIVQRMGKAKGSWSGN
jgi:hypothetical protein